MSFNIGILSEDLNFIRKKCRLCQSEEENLKKCAKCQSVWYCSKEHQKEDWGRHKISECKNLLNKKENRKNLRLHGLKSGDFEIWKNKAMNNESSKAKYTLGRYYEFGFGVL
jgi:hypothetical protein